MLDLEPRDPKGDELGVVTGYIAFLVERGLWRKVFNIVKGRSWTRSNNLRYVTLPVFRHLRQDLSESTENLRYARHPPSLMKLNV